MSSRDRIIELDAQGVSTPHIAIQLGVTQSLVERILDQQAGANDIPIIGTPIIPPPPPKAEPATPGPAKPKPARPPAIIRKPVERPIGPKSRHQPIKHGTPHGAAAHQNRGEQPCEACLEARRTYQRDNARKNRGTVRTRAAYSECGTNSGYVRHRRNNETACDPCRIAHNEYQRAQDAKRRAKQQSALAMPVKPELSPVGRQVLTDTDVETVTEEAS